jgi:hypothetical protein
MASKMIVIRLRVALQVFSLLSLSNSTMSISLKEKLYFRES